MKNTILAFLFFISTFSYAQEFYFPKKNYKDEVLLTENLPNLASQIQGYLVSKNKISARTNMHLALVSNQFDLAANYVDSMRIGFEDDYKNGLFAVYEVYAKTKSQQVENKNNDFKNLFSKQFSERFLKLNTASQYFADRDAQTSVKDIKKSFDQLLSTLKESDTLQLNNALRLISTYNSYNVYNQTSASMIEFVENFNNKTYQIDTVLVKTRDNEKLQAIVVQNKKAKQKVPTILHFNIYAGSSFDMSKAKFFAAEGYACVIAYVRGKGNSESEISPFENDGQDIYDIIEWISKQEWSNKKVGMAGGSYLGFTQWSALKNPHPALKTIVPSVAVGPGIDYPMNGNVFMSYMLRWIRYVTNNRTVDYTDFGDADKWNSLYKKWYEEGISFRSLDSLEGKQNAIFQRWLNHPSYDDFWQNMIPYQTEFSDINIPILTTTGYFDDDQMGALYYYKQHRLYNPKANHYLLIGPYSHGGAQLYPDKEVGGYKVDSVATSFNVRNLSLKWFDYILKGKEKPKILKNKVNYQVMGTNQWKHSSDLQGMSNDTLTFYFDGNQKKDFYTLSTKPNSNYIEQKVDLANRNDAKKFVFKVIQDSISKENTNSLTFISEPFEQAIAISGAFKSSLQVAINKFDMDVVIRAYELMPNGQYFSLFTESGFSALQRASYAKDNKKRQLLSPNQKETIENNTSYITSKKLNKGSRLVITLGINKSPYWQINYGTGKNVSDETVKDATEPLKIKWYGDSYLKVPILHLEK